LLLLKAKGLEGFVKGESTEPQDKSSSEWKTWDATNSLVVAWMLSSMSTAIASTVDTIPTAAEIWKALANMYSGAGNVMLMVETEDRLHDLKQGERSVMDYVAELKRLWTDLDHYDPIDIPNPEYVLKIKKWIERRRVLQFLRGLNPEFEGRRATMFHQDTLPTLDEAISAIAREEVRLKVMKDITSPPPRPAFAATRIRESRECFNCGDPGHMIRDCPQPLKFNRGRGRGSFRGAARGGRGRGGRSGYRANAAVREEELPRSGEISSIEYEEQRQTKGKTVRSANQDQDEYSGDFINFAYMDEGNYAHAFVLPCISQSSWILDSGASRHVTGTSSEFVSYIQYPPHVKKQFKQLMYITTH
jgi:hypothetical protein